MEWTDDAHATYWQKAGEVPYPCLAMPVVLPIPHQAFKARSLWHQSNVDEGSRQNEGVSLVEALALKNATRVQQVGV